MEMGKKSETGSVSQEVFHSIHQIVRVLGRSKNDIVKKKKTTLWFGNEESRMERGAEAVKKVEKRDRRVR